MPDETLLIKAIASSLLDPILKNEFYNDAEDYINYEDPTTKIVPRSETEIQRMENLLKNEKDDILDEITQQLQAEGFTSFEEISENAQQVRDMIVEEKGEYRRRLWDAIKS